MACPATSDRSFGPQVRTTCRAFDFTLAFEDIVFACIPAAIFVILSVPQTCLLLWKRQIILRRRSFVFTAKLSSLLLLFSTQVAFLFLRTQFAPLQTGASIAGDTLSVFATAAAMILCFASHRRSVRSSTLLSLYLSVSVVLLIARVRTIWLLAPLSPGAGVMTAQCAFTAIILLLESIASSIPPVSLGEKEVTPEEYSGFWNRTSFAWLAATFRLGYAKVISVSDLPHLDPKLGSRTLYKNLTSTWANYNHQNRYSLLQACFQSYLPSLLSTIVPRLCVTAFTFLQPFLIKTTITFISQSSRMRDGNHGKGLIGAWALVFLGIAVSNSVYKYQNLRFVIRLRGGLIGLVYERMLRTRSVDMGEITAVSLMGTDVERILSGMRLFNATWGSLLDIAIACWLLGRELSLACLAPVVLILLFITATSRVSATAGSAQRQWIEKVQERLRVTSDILGNVKTIKMLGILHTLSEIVLGLRDAEIRTSMRFRKILVTTLLLSLTPMNLAPVVTFALYVIISVYWKAETLLTAQAFTSIALIFLLTTPVIVFIQALPMVIQCKGSFDRIQEYCNYSMNPAELITGSTGTKTHADKDPENKTRSLGLDNLPNLGQSRHGPRLSFEGRSFAWNRSSRPFLKSITLKIDRHSLNIIVGPTGSGKTALLKSLLGEMVSVASAQDRNSNESVAYCAQEPWLENKTIRQNIIGVLPYERNWFEMVKWACGLNADIDQLDKRDNTHVGSQGLNLSGGQKKRIALARAIYSRRSTILLDDVFSSVDANTTAIVSSRLFGQEGFLRRQKTTVIMVTHNLTIIRLADKVITLQDGMVSEAGSLTSLLQAPGYVSNLGLSTVGDVANTEVLPADHGAIHEKPCSPHDALVEEADRLPPDVERKTGDASVYKYYIASSGYLPVFLNIISMLIWIFCTEFSTIWVQWWSEANEIHSNKNVGMYLGVYAILGLVATAGAFSTAWTGIISIISNSATRMHSDLLHAMLQAPFRFFAATDNGVILNHFSQDMELIDMELPTNMINYTSTAMICLVKVIILAVFSKYLGIAIPFVGAILYFLQRFYLRTSRQMRLLAIEAKSPLYAFFTECVAGAITIRAFGWQSQYEDQNYHLIDESQRPEYMLSCIQFCLGFVLELMVAIIAITLVTIAVVLTDSFTPGSVGVGLVMVVGFSEVLVRLIESWTKVESSIGAVTRVKRFLVETASKGRESTNPDVPPAWPPAGAIQITNLTAFYNSKAGPVLRNITMTFEPGQHVAVCGRSGSGKSSLVLSLMRMIDITDDSKVTIDNVNVCLMNTEDLGKRVNVIAQDSFLLPETIRLNIDPFAVAVDVDIISALKRVGLWSIVEERGGLDMAVDSSVWSAGQKQLLCFARAMLRKCKILVLDEAMSNLDPESEARAQDIIDTEFKEYTVISIMHRLKHVDSYHKVAVFEGGLLVEYDKPSKLLSQVSLFAELVHASEH